VTALLSGGAGGRLAPPVVLPPEFRPGRADADTSVKTVSFLGDSGGRLGPPVMLPPEFRRGGATTSAARPVTSEHLVLRAPARPRGSAGVRARTASPLKQEVNQPQRVGLDDADAAAGSSAAPASGTWLGLRAADAAAGSPKVDPVPRTKSAEGEHALAAMRLLQAIPLPFDVREEGDRLRQEALRPEVSDPKLWPGPGDIALAAPTAPPTAPQGRLPSQEMEEARSSTSSDESTFAGFIEDPLEQEHSGEVHVWLGNSLPVMHVSASLPPAPPVSAQYGEDEEVKPDRSHF